MRNLRQSDEMNFLAAANLVPYHEAYREIRNADLLLFRKTGVISIAGRGIHSHAAKAAWWGNDLFCLEVREFHGGRAVTLESQARRYPGRIDVFRANAFNRWPEYNRNRAAAAMRKFAGCDYGYWNVFKTALTHVPFLRFLYRPVFANDQDENWKKFLFGDVETACFENENQTDSAPWEELSEENYIAWLELKDQRDSKTSSPKENLKANTAANREISRRRISPPYCSEACSIADRIGGGVNPVELLSDRFTEPADLARSPFYHYLFTLE